MIVLFLEALGRLLYVFDDIGLIFLLKQQDIKDLKKKIECNGRPMPKADQTRQRPIFENEIK